MELYDITIGADPELFIINEKTKKVVSSIGLIPGEKGNPYVADDMPNGFGLETDNIVAEFNIPPCDTEEAFINNIEYMKEYINKFVKSKDERLGILCAASKSVDKSQLNSPQAKMFGCDVDYNVYTGEPNPKPKGETTNLRSCGFHIHIGYGNNNIDTSLQLIRYLDMYLGLPSILKDKDKRRRSLYGKAGCFRLTPYGVEYRVLSSAMMKDVPTLKFVWAQLMKAINAYNSCSPLAPDLLMTKAINETDTKLAQELIDKFGIV